jgi:3-oxo-5-alpha-steroid 4-dehydrogenase 3
MNDFGGLISLFMVLLSPVYVLLSLVAILSRRIRFLKTLASHGKTKEQSRVSWSWNVPKRYFTWFYIIGLMAATTIFYNTTKWPLSLTQTTLFIHLFRRLYECLFVHKFGRESEMHVAGCILGIGHYVALPLVFTRIPTQSELSFFFIICFLWNFWMQWEQHIHHKILADMRQGPESTNRAAYGLPPNRRWFRFCLCPHYLAEILIYVSWAVLLAQQEDWPLSSSLIGKEGAAYQSILRFGLAQRH